jgi:hypothetical protein
MAKRADCRKADAAYRSAKDAANEEEESRRPGTGCREVHRRSALGDPTTKIFIRRAPACQSGSLRSDCWANIGPGYQPKYYLLASLLPHKSTASFSGLWPGIAGQFPKDNNAILSMVCVWIEGEELDVPHLFGFLPLQFLRGCVSDGDLRSSSQT